MSSYHNLNNQNTSTGMKTQYKQQTVFTQYKDGFKTENMQSFR